jgi:hypothetical protein
MAQVGHEERLVKGNGYYYFQGGGSGAWEEQGVYTAHFNDLTLEEWVHERDNLASRLAGGRAPKEKA